MTITSVGYGDIPVSASNSTEMLIASGAPIPLPLSSSLGLSFPPPSHRPLASLSRQSSCSSAASCGASSSPRCSTSPTPPTQPTLSIGRCGCPLTMTHCWLLPIRAREFEELNHCVPPDRLQLPIDCLLVAEPRGAQPLRAPPRAARAYAHRAARVPRRDALARAQPLPPAALLTVLPQAAAGDASFTADCLLTASQGLF